MFVQYSIVLHGTYLLIPHDHMKEGSWANCESHVLQPSESTNKKKDNQKAPKMLEFKQDK